MTRVNTQPFGQTHVCQTPQPVFFPLTLTFHFKLFFGLDICLSHKNLSRPGSLQMEPHMVTGKGHCLEAQSGQGPPRARSGSSGYHFFHMWHLERWPPGV